MGNLARDVLFRMPARDFIRYTLFKVTSIDELGARTSSCNDSETALTNPIEYMYPTKWLRSLFITSCHTKGCLSKGRYDETFAGEDVFITDQTLCFRSRFS